MVRRRDEEVASEVVEGSEAVVVFGTEGDVAGVDGEEVCCLPFLMRCLVPGQGGIVLVVYVVFVVNKAVVGVFMLGYREEGSPW